MNTNPRPPNGLSPCLQYSLPTPKGGKYAINPHLTEDQRFPQLRLSRKARQKTDVFAPDYTAGASPFAENDVSSRSATLQVRDSTLGAGRRRLNPNASRKKFVKKRWSSSSTGRLDGCPGDLCQAPLCRPCGPRTQRRAWLPQRRLGACSGASGWVCGGAWLTPDLCASREPGFLPCWGSLMKTEQTVPGADLQALKTGTSKL